MPAAVTLTPAKLSKLLDTIRELEPIFEAVKAHAIAQSHAGVVIPGYEPDWTNPRRKWLSEPGTATALAKLGLTEEERYTTELVSPAEAEKRLRAKKLWPQKPRGSAAADFTDPFANLVGYAERKPTIRKTTE